MTSLNTSGGSYSGMDTFSTAQVQTRKLFQYDPRQSYQSVVLSNLDLAVNATPSRVLDLLKVEMETAQISMLDRIGGFFYGDGTGNSSKDFNGLANLVDDGTTAATVGGLTRATDPTPLNSSVVSSVGQISRARVAQSFDLASHGAQTPTLMVTDKATWTILEGLYAPQIRLNYDGYAQINRYGLVKDKNSLKGEIAFNVIVFRGTPIVRDEKATAGTLWFLNENYLHWFGLKHPTHSNITLTTNTIESGAYNDAPKAPGFAWTGLKEPVNQDAEIGQILLYGNLVSWSPRHMALLSGITS